MRPDILNPLFAEVETLKGVGPGIARPLDRLGLKRVMRMRSPLSVRGSLMNATLTTTSATRGICSLLPLLPFLSGSGVHISALGVWEYFLPTCF